MRLRWLSVLVLIAAACAGSVTPESEPPSSDPLAGQLARIEADVARLQGVAEPMRGSILSWYNATGMPQLQPGVWNVRLNQLCERRFWEDPGLVEAQADNYLVLDRPLAINAAELEIDPDGAYTTLWVMALNHCRSDVPIEAVEAGPPWIHDG